MNFLSGRVHWISNFRYHILEVKSLQFGEHFLLPEISVSVNYFNSDSKCESTHKNHTMACLQLPFALVFDSNMHLSIIELPVQLPKSNKIDFITSSLWSHGPCGVWAFDLKDPVLSVSGFRWIFHKTIRRCSQPWMLKV